MRTRSLVQGVVAASLLLVPARAWAVDAGSAGGKPIVLDVTETSIVAQHFDPRKLPNNTPIGPVTVEDSGWGEWINRINAALRWDRWTAGLRLDSSLYWRRPADSAL